MCHFYANPLSIAASPNLPAILVGDDALQPEHIEAFRHLPSFRITVERAIDMGVNDTLYYARELLNDDSRVRQRVQVNPENRKKWLDNVLLSLLIVEAAGAQEGTFSRAYVQAMDEGISLSEHPTLVDCVRRMSVGELIGMLRRLNGVIHEGDPSLNFGGTGDQRDLELAAELEQQLAVLEGLQEKAAAEDFTLRSKYSGQSKVMRTTVIAQKVQLSQDSATLRDEDMQFTATVDEIASLLRSRPDDPKASDVLFSECWLYDSKSPSRDVFVPRPQAVFQRSLARPHDYLACACCKPGEAGIQATSPATSILYHLYLETGNLANVADLWSAFYAVVSEQEADERKALVAFYRALAELKALGFVKASRRKADHIAKVKWM